MYNIARSPEVQKKCFEEIFEIYGKDTKAPTTLSELNRLSYLDLVIKETLRLFPSGGYSNIIQFRTVKLMIKQKLLKFSVPLVGRMAPEDIHLSKFENFYFEKAS